MTAQLIDGKAIAQKIRDEVAAQVAKRVASGKPQCATPDSREPEASIAQKYGLVALSRLNREMVKPSGIVLVGATLIIPAEGPRRRQGDVVALPAPVLWGLRLCCFFPP
jgi:hypothetical protein